MKLLLSEERHFCFVQLLDAQHDEQTEQNKQIAHMDELFFIHVFFHIFHIFVDLGARLLHTITFYVQIKKSILLSFC